MKKHYKATGSRRKELVKLCYIMMSRSGLKNVNWQMNFQFGVSCS